MWKVEVVRHTPEGDFIEVPVACRSRRYAVNLYKGFVDFLKVPATVYLVSPENEEVGMFSVENC